MDLCGALHAIPFVSLSLYSSATQQCVLFFFLHLSYLAAPAVAHDHNSRWAMRVGREERTMYCWDVDLYFEMILTLFLATSAVYQRPALLSLSFSVSLTFQTFQVSSGST